MGPSPVPSIDADPWTFSHFPRVYAMGMGDHEPFPVSNSGPFIRGNARYIVGMKAVKPGAGMAEAHYYVMKSTNNGQTWAQAAVPYEMQLYWPAGHGGYGTYTYWQWYAYRKADMLYIVVIGPTGGEYDLDGGGNAVTPLSLLRFDLSTESWSTDTIGECWVWPTQTETGNTGYRFPTVVLSTGEVLTFRQLEAHDPGTGWKEEIGVYSWTNGEGPSLTIDTATWSGYTVLTAVVDSNDIVHLMVHVRDAALFYDRLYHATYSAGALAISEEITSPTGVLLGGSGTGYGTQAGIPTIYQQDGTEWIAVPIFGQTQDGDQGFFIARSPITSPAWTFDWVDVGYLGDGAWGSVGDGAWLGTCGWDGTTLHGFWWSPTVGRYGRTLKHSTWDGSTWRAQDDLLDYSDEPLFPQQEYQHMGYGAIGTGFGLIFNFWNAAGTHTPYYLEMVTSSGHFAYFGNPVGFGASAGGWFL